MKKRNIPVFCFIVVCSILSGCTNTNPDLPQPKTTVKEEIKTEELKDETFDFVLEVPKGWEKDKLDIGYRYTEPLTGTELVITGKAYYPAINNVNGTTIANSVNENGIKLLNFAKGTGNQFDYKLSYQNSENAEMIEYQHYFWTYDKIYTLQYISEKKYEVKFSPYYQQALKTLQPLSKADCLIENYAGYYNDSTGTYIEYPYIWSYSGFSSGFSITSQDTGTVITIDNIGGIENFGELTELQYHEIMKKSVQNIALSNYYNNGNQIGAELFFVDSNVKYYVRNYMINKGAFVVNLTFVSNTAYTQKDYPIFETMINSICWWGEG